MRSVALIGVDGAGKSTTSQEVVRAMAVPARYLYMGVNAESSTRMLPTTRLAMAVKRARGRRPDMTAYWSSPASSSTSRLGMIRGAHSAVRLLAWLAEEWYRAAVAVTYMRRGYLVVFDRHFLYDYYASHVAPRPGRSTSARIHGKLLDRLYPRPDFVICLDAPSDLLHARRNEHSVEALEERRREYLALRDVVSDFAVVDAAQPRSTVVAEVKSLIEARLK